MKNKLEIDKVATIDIGSNAIRLLISNVFSVNGKLHHTKNSLYRVQLRLGDDSFNKGIISPKNLDKLKSTLKSFKFLMDVNDVKKSDKISKIFCFPGNAGTSDIAENIKIDLENFENIKISSISDDQNSLNFERVSENKSYPDQINKYYYSLTDNMKELTVKIIQFDKSKDKMVVDEYSRKYKCKKK